MQLTCCFAMLEVQYRKLQEYLWTSPIPGDFDQIRESSPFPGGFIFLIISGSTCYPSLGNGISHYKSGADPEATNET
jgi:hypothetical protein